MKLFLKGERCESAKCAFSRRDYPPGMRTWRRGKLSDYALQLREKQKAKRFYGLRESQFVRYFRESERLPGNTGETLLAMLECRLDNVLCRAGFVASHAEARQFVAHGHVTVNGRKTDIPSYVCKPGDVIGVKERGSNVERVKANAAAFRGRGKPGWLQIQPEAAQISILAAPTREEISLPVQEQLIVELCSR
jgi:small subunit ribosomal protein S4